MVSLLTATVYRFVIYLFRRDIQANPDASTELCVPLMWMFLAGSRYVSTWLSLRGPSTVQSNTDGSPLDATVFFALIMGGMVILARRRIPWGELFDSNKLLLFYLLYCFISISWSDVPFTAFKRWFKDLGNPIMALVILTTPRPLQAIGVVFRRLAILLLPLSLVFIRYFPQLGRDYHQSSGMPMYTGVATQKNVLGQMCLLVVMYGAWQVLQEREAFLAWPRSARLHLWILVSLGMYLLYLSNSQTSLSSVVLALTVFVAARVRFVRRVPSRVVDLTICGAAVALLLDTLFDLKSAVFDLLGRDPDLTSRTDIWAIVLELSTSPLWGTGFMSFWTGDRLEVLWSRIGARIVQAHNGYIEQYLNLGYVGVAFILLLMARGLLAARSLVRTNPSFAVWRVGCIVVAIAYNYTEAAFYGVNNVWLIFLLGVLHVPEHLTAVPETIGEQRGDGAFEVRPLAESIAHLDRDSKAFGASGA